MSDRDRSERPPLIPSDLFPTDKSVPAIWNSQREQAKQMVALINAGATQVQSMRKLEGRLDVMSKTLEEHDKRMDTIEHTITKWGGIIVGATAVLQIASMLWSHFGK